MPSVKAEAKIEVKGGKRGVRVPSKVIVTVEKTIRGGRDLVREGRRRFSRAAIAGEKRVRREAGGEGVGWGQEECYVRVRLGCGMGSGRLTCGIGDRRSCEGGVT